MKDSSNTRQKVPQEFQGRGLCSKCRARVARYGLEAIMPPELQSDLDHLLDTMAKMMVRYQRQLATGTVPPVSKQALDQLCAPSAPPRSLPEDWLANLGREPL